MRKSGKRARARLFDLGNDRCPICLSPFTIEEVERGEKVTLEHVPPKSLGPNSRWICLTCADCNQGAGKEIDQIAYKLANAPKVRVDIKGVPHRGELAEPDADGTIPIRMSNLRLSPNVVRNLRHSDFKVHIKIPNEHYAAVSWLKSAYLALFSLLGRHGYRYAEGSVGSLVREQIANPSKQIIGKFLGEVPEDLESGDGVFMHTGEPKLWIVRLGKVIVFLPRTGDVSFAGLSQDGGSLEFHEDDLCYWRLRRFGEGPVDSVEMNKTTLDSFHFLYKITEDPFGRIVRVTSRGKKRHFVVADHGTDFLTFLY